MVNLVPRSAPTLEKAVAGASEMLEGIVMELVVLPQRIVVYQTIQDNAAKLTLWVDASDLENVIGRGGETQKSLSAVVKAVGRKNGFNFSLAIGAREA